MFGLFILVQFQYLFSRVDENQLHQIGLSSITYSEYVRRGFFELLIASAIVVGIISYVLHLLKHINSQLKAFVQGLSGIVLIETGVILLSDVQRIQLYAAEHGLTRARIFGFIFLVYLAALLAILLVNVWRRLDQKYQFLSLTLVSLIALLSLSFINIDGLIATQYKPTVNKEIDYVYITSLSADAIDGWSRAFIESQQTVNQLENIPKLSGED